MIRICLYTATWCPFSQTFLESDKGKSFLREIDDAHTSGICRFSHFKNELAFAKLRYLSKQDVQLGEAFLRWSSKEKISVSCFIPIQTIILTFCPYGWYSDGDAYSFMKIHLHTYFLLVYRM